MATDEIVTAILAEAKRQIERIGLPEAYVADFMLDALGLAENQENRAKAVGVATSIVMDVSISEDFRTDPQNAYDNFVLDYEEYFPHNVGTEEAETWQNFFYGMAERDVRKYVTEVTK